MKIQLAFCLMVTFIFGGAHFCFAAPDQKSLDTALVQAVVEGNVAKTKSLLAKGASANASGDSGEKPLVIASYINMSPDQEGFPHSFELFHLLLNRGADVNLADGNGTTALMGVSSVGEVRAAKLLISKGAKINARNNEGRTALMQAASSDVETVKFLVSKGAVINAKDNDGVTALMLAAYSTREGGSYTSSDIVRYLLSKNVRVDAADKNGNTALVYATMINKYDYNEGLLDTIKALIAKGADLNARTSNGNTPLKWAKASGNPKIIRLLQNTGAHQTK